MCLCVHAYEEKSRHDFIVSVCLTFCARFVGIGGVRRCRGVRGKGLPRCVFVCLGGVYRSFVVNLNFSVSTG